MSGGGRTAAAPLKRELKRIRRQLTRPLSQAAKEHYRKRERQLAERLETLLAASKQNPGAGGPSNPA